MVAVCEPSTLIPGAIGAGRVQHKKMRVKIEGGEIERVRGARSGGGVQTLKSQGVNVTHALPNRDRAEENLRGGKKGMVERAGVQWRKRRSNTPTRGRKEAWNRKHQYLSSPETGAATPSRGSFGKGGEGRDMKKVLASRACIPSTA